MTNNNKNNNIVALLILTLLSITMFRTLNAFIPHRNYAKSYISSKPLSSSANHDSEHEELVGLTISGYKRPVVNWYPGHIAKAERMLAETLRSVDVVLEVRDARAPKATAHPRVGEWAAGKPRLVIMTKGDLVPNASKRAWQKSYEVLGAAKWDNEMDKSVRNQAMQVIRERQKYGDGIGVVRSSDTIIKSSTTNKNIPTSEKKSISSSSGSTRRRNKKELQQSSNFSNVDQVLYINAKHGEGIHNLQREILKSGLHINERRRRRGLTDRPLRVGVIGYPNVGKSALINKLLGGKKRAKSQNTPGVTRSLQWIRVNTSNKPSIDTSANIRKSFELLDSPGIIPANMEDQSDALLLAAINSIGEAAYDNQAVAAYLMEWMKTLHLIHQKDVTVPHWRLKVIDRYRFDPMLPIKDQPQLRSYLQNNEEDERLLTGEDMLFMVADNTCMGDPENAARKILQDFRNGRMGPVALQIAPDSIEDRGQKEVPLTPDSLRESVISNVFESFLANQSPLDRADNDAILQKRTQLAKKVVEKKGLELPPLIISAEHDGHNSNNNKIKESDVGKGLFEGW